MRTNLKRQRYNLAEVTLMHGDTIVNATHPFQNHADSEDKVGHHAPCQAITQSHDNLNAPNYRMQGVPKNKKKHEQKAR